MNVGSFSFFLRGRIIPTGETKKLFREILENHVLCDVDFFFMPHSQWGVPRGAPRSPPREEHREEHDSTMGTGGVPAAGPPIVNAKIREGKWGAPREAPL